MSSNARLFVALCCLGVGVALTLGLDHHLASAQKNSYPEMLKGLAEVPKQLRVELPPLEKGSAPRSFTWDSIENPQLDELRKVLTYRVDDLLSRYYQAKGGPLLNVYIVHSRTGEDRLHHPEICIREARGAPEDFRARTRLQLGDDSKRSVQRFRFQTGTGQYTTVYYWHYSFEPTPRPGQSPLQLLHQQLATPSPSVTVQVSSNARLAELERVESLFLPALDDRLQTEHLPKSRMKCNRIPIGLVRE